ncbi:MAG: (4Fe-4S)-binding protein, partial [Chloroflexi bacterium]|nr:(4Fe-4S)-binding protein [Chloroflexota bacterium]
MPPKFRSRDYTGKDIRVSYDIRRCIHAAECVRGLPEVFDTRKRPWIEVDNADSDRVAEVVIRCPAAIPIRFATDPPLLKVPCHSIGKPSNSLSHSSATNSNVLKDCNHQRWEPATKPANAAAVADEVGGVVIHPLNPGIPVLNPFGITVSANISSTSSRPTPFSGSLCSNADFQSLSRELASLPLKRLKSS